MSGGGLAVVAVPAAEVRPLRRAVLRPHQPPESLVYPGDDAPGVLHAAVLEDERVIGTGSVAPEPDPRDPRPGDWRLRGMACAPEARSRGVGAALLRRCLDHAAGRGGTRVWCNARVEAAAFYERHGFVVDGEPFAVPAMGRHVLMRRSVR